MYWTTVQTSTSLSAAMKSQTKASSLLVFTPCECSGEDVVETMIRVARDHPRRHSHADLRKRPAASSLAID